MRTEYKQIDFAALYRKITVFPLAESWGQPPIGLFTPVLYEGQTYWQPLIGVDTCSSSVTVGTVYGVPVPDDDITAWDALSDEAFLSKGL